MARVVRWIKNPEPKRTRNKPATKIDMAGLAAAQTRSHLGGRRKSLTPHQRALVVSLYEEKKLPIMKICEMMEISKPTLYSYVREAQRTGKSSLNSQPVSKAQ